MERSLDLAESSGMERSFFLAEKTEEVGRFDLCERLDRYCCITMQGFLCGGLSS